MRVMQDKSRKKRNSSFLSRRCEGILQILNKSLSFTKQNFKQIFPWTFILAMVGYIIQPYSIPTLVDAVDWLAFGIFIAGVIIVAILHGTIVFSLNTLLLGDRPKWKTALKYGVMRSSSVCFLGVIYFGLVAIGTLCLVLPGIYLLVSLSLAPFLIVLMENGIENSFFNNIKEAFIESYQIVKGNWRMLFFMITLLLGFTIGLEWIIQRLLIDQIVLASLLVVLTRSVFLTYGYFCMLVFLYNFETDLEFVREVS